MRVLVIAHAAAIRYSLGRILVSLEHEIAGEAGSLVAGLDRACEVAPDAVVLDGRLISSDVTAGIARVRAAVPKAAIVAIAARDELSLVRDALAAGAASAIRRPILRSSVIAAFANPRGDASDRPSSMLPPGAPRSARHG